MYRIGELSQQTGLSVKTLRYYDEIDLLKPCMIDTWTNYRYYDDNSLEFLKKILYLKKIGFSLEEIKNNINNIDVDILNSKREELVSKRDYISDQIDEIDLFMVLINSL